MCCHLSHGVGHTYVCQSHFLVHSAHLDYIPMRDFVKIIDVFAQSLMVQRLLLRVPREIYHQVIDNLHNRAHQRDYLGGYKIYSSSQYQVVGGIIVTTELTRSSVSMCRG